MILAVAACSKATGFPITLHQGFFTVVIFYALVMALWGFFLFIRGSNPSGGYLGALVIAEGVAVLQGLIGLVVFFAGNRPYSSLHWLYGIVIATALPAAYGFSAKGTERRDSLYFAIGALVIVIIALVRAGPTGCPQ